MFFKHQKQSDNQEAYLGETQSRHSFDVLAVLEQHICGSRWHAQHSISRIVGMALGGLRSASLFSNEQLNDQADALSCLTRKTLPLVLHVQDLSAGNSQTLRLPFFRFFAGSCQQSADFTLIGRRLSESALLPVMVIHSRQAQTYQHPSANLIKDFLGQEADIIDTPTPAQIMLFGKRRRRLPEYWNIDQPMSIGLSVPAALRDRQSGAMQTFFIEPMQDLVSEAVSEFAKMTGRNYAAAEFLNEAAPHQVVTTEAIPADLDDTVPLVKVNFVSSELRRRLKGKKLTFIDRNYSQALGTALGLSGFSLVHYGMIDEQTVQAALQLNDDKPMALAGVRYLFSAPLTPKEEIYNQQARDLCALPDEPSQHLSPPNHAINTPLQLSSHPECELPLADLHRFWAHNGKYLSSGQIEHAVATPILATGVLPAGSGKMWAFAPQAVAVRIVEPAALLQAMIDRMNQENYAMEALEAYARPLAQNIKARMHCGADFFAVLAEAFNVVRAGAGEAAVELNRQWRNMHYFIPPSCALVTPFVEQGGIRISDDSIKHRDVFNLLPNTAARFLNEPDSVLLDKDGFASFVRMENTAEQEIHHLFSAVACVAAKGKAKTLLDQVEDSLEALKLQISRKLSVSLSEDIDQALAELTRNDLTLAELAQKVDREQAPVDRQWLIRVSNLQRRLTVLREKCRHSMDGKGRASHGVVSQNAAGTYPWSPVIVPWAQNGNGEGAELALGIWEAHMSQLCDDFIALRQCALELAQRYNPRVHDRYFADFDWRQLSQDELKLCPPLVLTGTDTDFFRNTGNLNELFRTGAPLKVLVFDTLHAHPAGPLQHLLAHDIYVLRGSLVDKSHLLQGMATGFCASRPALLQVLTPDVPDYQAFARHAHENGLYALFSGFHEDLEQTAVKIHPDAYLGDAFLNQQTFADLVQPLPMFAHHFTLTESTDGTPLADYVMLDADDRAETMAVVRVAGAQGQTKVFKVSNILIQRIEEQQQLKALLRRFTRNLTEQDQAITKAGEDIQRQVLETVTQTLIELARP